MSAVNQPEDLLTRIKKLEQQVKDMRRGTLSNAVISQGQLEVRAPTGQVLFRAGEIPWGGGTKSGTATYRVDGSISTVAWDEAGGSGYWAVLDEGGSIIFSSDTTSGSGIALPYIPVVALPWSQVLTPSQSTTNAAFENLHRLHYMKQQPWVKVLLIVQSDAATTGEVQLVDGTTVLTTATTIAASTNAYVWIDAPVGGAHLEVKFLDVQARRTAGAGAIRVGVAFVTGRQS